MPKSNSSGGFAGGSPSGGAAAFASMPKSNSSGGFAGGSPSGEAAAFASMGTTGRGGGISQNTQIESNATVGTVIVNTQATDADGMARDVRGALGNEFGQGLVFPANSGVAQK